MVGPFFLMVFFKAACKLEAAEVISVKGAVILLFDSTFDNIKSCSLLFSSVRPSVRHEPVSPVATHLPIFLDRSTLSPVLLVTASHGRSQRVVPYFISHPRGLNRGSSEDWEAECENMLQDFARCEPLCLEYPHIPISECLNPMEVIIRQPWRRFGRRRICHLFPCIWNALHSWQKKTCTTKTNSWQRMDISWNHHHWRGSAAQQIRK